METTDAATATLEDRGQPPEAAGQQLSQSKILRSQSTFSRTSALKMAFLRAAAGATKPGLTKHPNTWCNVYKGFDGYCTMFGTTPPFDLTRRRADDCSADGTSV